MSKLINVQDIYAVAVVRDFDTAKSCIRPISVARPKTLLFQGWPSGETWVQLACRFGRTTCGPGMT